MLNNNRAQLFKKRLTPIQTNNNNYMVNANNNNNGGNIILIGERNPSSNQQISNISSNNNNIISGGGNNQVRDRPRSSSSSSSSSSNNNNINNQLLPSLITPQSASSSTSSNNNNNIFYSQHNNNPIMMIPLTNNNNNFFNTNYNCSALNPNICLTTTPSSSASNNNSTKNNPNLLLNNGGAVGGFSKQQQQQQGNSNNSIGSTTTGYLQVTTPTSSSHLKVLTLGMTKSKGSMSDLRYSVDTTCTGTSIEEDIEDSFNSNDGYFTPDEQGGLTPQKVGRSPLTDCDEGDEIMESIDSLEQHHYQESRDTPTSTSSSSSPIKHNLTVISQNLPSTPTKNSSHAAAGGNNNNLPIGGNNNSNRQQSNFAKKRPQNLSINNKSDTTQSNNFVGPHSDINTSPVKNHLHPNNTSSNSSNNTFRAPSPINSNQHHSNSSSSSSTSSNNSSLNNSLVTGSSNFFFLPSTTATSTDKIGSSTTNNNNQNSSQSSSSTPHSMSIHTFSSQPSPSHHVYFMNKNRTNTTSTGTSSHSSKISRAPTPTATLNDYPASSSSSSESRYTTGKDSNKIGAISKNLPPIQRKDEQHPSQSLTPRIPKPTTPINEDTTISTSSVVSMTSTSNNDTITSQQHHHQVSSNNTTTSTTSSRRSNASDTSSKVSTASSSTRRGSKSKKKLKTIKNYKKGDFIGCGASGKVFLGYNLDDGKFFAIKECTFDSVPEDILELKLQSLQREIDLMKELCHENIVQYYGAEVTGTTLNIFLEYVPGGSVSSLLRRYGRLSEDVVRHYTTQILKGLKYLHENRIVHRDIKGANILVSVEGAIKLADFGASRKIQDIMTLSTEFKSLLGTPHFMAPEVIMQTGHGRSADIWSIGCTVVEMYTGKPPFTEFKTAAAVMFHIAGSTEMPFFPDFVSEGCKQFLAKCFIRDPNQRATVDDLLNDPWILHQTDDSDEDEEEIDSIGSPATATASAFSSATPIDEDCINTFTPPPISGSDSPFLQAEPVKFTNNNDEINFDDGPPPLQLQADPIIIQNKEISNLQDIKEHKTPAGIVQPKKGYDSQKDISIFLRKSSMWQSRSFSNGEIIFPEKQNNNKHNSSDSSSDFEDEEITNYFDDDFEVDEGFNGLSSMKTEYDPQEPPITQSPEKKKDSTTTVSSKQKKVRRKLDEDLKKEIPIVVHQVTTATANTTSNIDNLDTSPKKEKKKKRKSVTQKFIDSGSTTTSNNGVVPTIATTSNISLPNSSDMDPSLFPVIEIPKKTLYQKEREKNDVRAKKEEEKIHLMERELSKLGDPSQVFAYQKSSAEKLESPKKIIPPIPHTSHSKSKSPARERSRIKSAPIKRVSCDDLSDTLSPITQLGKITSPTKTAPKQYRDYR